MHRPTDTYALMAEHGLELGVTLVVDGVVIAGILTGAKKYAEWFGREFRGGMERAGLGDALRAITEETAKDEPTEASLPEEPPATYDTLYLRNAEVQAGAPMNWPTFPFLVVSADHVGAFVPANNRPPEGS